MTRKPERREVAAARNVAVSRAKTRLVAAHRDEYRRYYDAELLRLNVRPSDRATRIKPEATP